MKLSDPELTEFRARCHKFYGVLVAPRPNGLRPSVSSFGKPKFAWARVTKKGRVHAIDTMIFRWNHLGGTWEKPYITIATACFANSEWWEPVSKPDRGDLCLRCVGHVIGGPK